MKCIPHAGIEVWHTKAAAQIVPRYRARECHAKLLRYKATGILRRPVLTVNYVILRARAGGIFLEIHENIIHIPKGGARGNMNNIQMDSQ